MEFPFYSEQLVDVRLTLAYVHTPTCYCVSDPRTCNTHLQAALTKIFAYKYFNDVNAGETLPFYKSKLTYV